MTIAEKIELALIPVIGLGILAVQPELPGHIRMGTLFLCISVLLLLQGLIRDICLLIRQKYSDLTTAHKTSQCICLESTIGITGVIAGILFSVSGIDGSLSIKTWMWSLIAVAVMASGFFIKDYVFTWNPLGIRRDKDHTHIIVAWKK